MKFNLEDLLETAIKAVVRDSTEHMLENARGHIRGSLLSTIEIGEYSGSYNKINKTVHDLDPVKYDRNKIPTASKRIFDLAVNTTYIIKRNDVTIKVETFIELADSIYAQKKLRLTLRGKNKHKYREYIMNSAMRLSDDEKIYVRFLGEAKTNTEIRPHSFDNVVLGSNQIEYLKKRLITWCNDVDWYHEHDLVHKIGILFDGPPGTGKSTLTKAISNFFGNIPILMINAADVMQSVNEINSMRMRYSGLMIVLIEDLDMLFTARKNLPNKSTTVTTINNAAKPSKSKKSDNESSDSDKLVETNTVLQLLDGVYSTEDTIYIGTTNNKNALDAALIRSGRFDIQMTIDLFDKESALMFLNKYGYTEDILQEGTLDNPIAPALLQSKIMEYRSMKLVNDMEEC